MSSISPSFFLVAQYVQAGMDRLVEREGVDLDAGGLTQEDW